MTPGKDQDAASSGDISDEISKAMAEAEAAVEALHPDSPEAAAAAAAEEDDIDAGDTATLEIESPDDDDAASELAADVTRLEGEVSATKDKWLRAVADLENYKKRTKREIDESVVRTTQSLLQAFLPTVDNLDRALEISHPALEAASDENENNVAQVVKGLQMVRDEFLGALKRHGIEPVDSVGHAFDPAVHDALQQIDSPDHAPGTVIREFEKGYKMKERLLRPARVIVAGAGSTGVSAGPGEN